MEQLFDNKSILDKENDRLEKLYGYSGMDSYEKAGTFQHVVSMAARIFDVPFALVNFVHEKSVLTEASYGLDDMQEVDREISLCSIAVLRDEVTVFMNTKEEPCLLANPFVHGEFGLQFYAAAPIKTSDGFNLGVVAIGDKRPRDFSREDEMLLQSLATVVMEELEERQGLRIR